MIIKGTTTVRISAIPWAEKITVRLFISSRSGDGWNAPGAWVVTKSGECWGVPDEWSQRFYVSLPRVYCPNYVSC